MHFLSHNNQASKWRWHTKNANIRYDSDWLISYDEERGWTNDSSIRLWSWPSQPCTTVLVEIRGNQKEGVTRHLCPSELYIACNIHIHHSKCAMEDPCKIRVGTTAGNDGRVKIVLPNLFDNYRACVSYVK